MSVCVKALLVMEVVVGGRDSKSLGGGTTVCCVMMGRESGTGKRRKMGGEGGSALLCWAARAGCGRRLGSCGTIAPQVAHPLSQFFKKKRKRKFYTCAPPTLVMILS